MSVCGAAGVFMFSAETGPAEGPLRVGVDSAWVSFEDQQSNSTFGFDAAVTELSVYGRIPCPLVLEAYAGARRIAADVSGSTSRVASSVGEAWCDPYVGLRIGSGNGKPLSGWVAADIGGFDVGSKLAFEVQAEGAWAFHDNMALVGGWRLLDVDYDRDDFRLDVQLRGFYLGVAVTF